MIKVKEFLDKNFITKGSTSTIKEDGRYDIRGAWLYTVEQTKNIDYKTKKPGKLDNCILCRCEDETLFINIIHEGKRVGKFDQFQTYATNKSKSKYSLGFSGGSKEDEIINYIQSYIHILNQNK